MPDGRNGIVGREKRLVFRGSRRELGRFRGGNRANRAVWLPGEVQLKV